jgi:hypothetical protein
MNLILFTMKNFNNDLSVQTYNQVGLQTESITIFNTQSLIDLPESANIGTDVQSNVLPDSLHVDAVVQNKSLWKLIKISLKKIICINSSDIDRTPQDVIEGNTMNNLDPSQNIPANAVISESSESNVQELVEASNHISELSESNVQELVNVYDIMDNFSFGLAYSQPNAIFDHKFIEGIHHYFICYSDTILSVNPDLINYFI